LVKILDLIIKNNSISRIDLAKATGLTRAAIGQLVEELMKSNLVIESGAAAPRGGRPPIILSPNPEAIYIIGAAVFNYSWSIIL
jgi:predicted ArsR family transcriptional regulator